MSRVAILCPGRGSYTERSLRSLPPDNPMVIRAEELRREYGLPSLIELDHAAKFDSGAHLLPANASPLIFLVTMLDSTAATRLHECVCVAGNSLGWYTALTVGGALSFDDGFRLVQEAGILQQEQYEREGGGQIVYPLIDDEWRAHPDRVHAVRDAVAQAEGEAFRSIELGGYAVLAGTEEGITHLLHSLPPVKLGSVSYPFRLLHHGPYHTPLLEPVAAQARERLARLVFQKPRATLIDGFGRRHTPWSASPELLRSYTLGAQIVDTYDFTTSVRVALREHAPEHLVLPGPGNTLGGVCGQILVAEGWRGIRSRSEFAAAQEGGTGVVVSMRR